MIPMLYNIFQNIEAERMLLNSFYEASITLIPKPDKNIIRKENCRPTLFINMDTKILSEILANRIQQCIKRILYHDQVGFIPGMQGWFNIQISLNVIHHNSRLNFKKSHDHMNRCRKSMWQNLSSFHDKKKIQKTRNKGNFLNWIMNIYKKKIKPTANIILNGEKPETFL